MSTMETGWTDQHGAKGHVVLGSRNDIEDYAPSLDGSGVNVDVVGVVEVGDPDSDSWHPTYLTRHAAENMVALLTARLERT